MNETTKEQLDHWKNRLAELEAWILNNGYEHVNYCQNQSDYNHAAWKVAQLEDRIEREVKGPRDVGQSYAKPILKQVYNNH